MATAFTRIFSDLHYGEHFSRVRRLAQLRPLLEGTSRVVINGDVLDTRTGPHPERVAALREEVRAFFAAHAPDTTFLTGNHDHDISDLHALDLAGGRVFVTHGDVLYEDIVPWSRDVPQIRRIFAEEQAVLGTGDPSLQEKLALTRRVAGRVPQRHHVEPNFWKYVRSFVTDTVWPPDRFLRVWRVWREAPARASALLDQHRPDARFMIIGHIHRPGRWSLPGGRLLINTGSFCPPLGALAVDITGERLMVRPIVENHDSFRVGAVTAEFALAAP